MGIETTPIGQAKVNELVNAKSSGLANKVQSTSANSVSASIISGLQSKNTNSDKLEVTKQDILSTEALQAATDDYFDEDGQKVSVRVDSDGQVHVKCVSGDVTMIDIKRALGLDDGVIRSNNNIETDGGNTRVSADQRNWFERNFGGGLWLDELNLREGEEITVPMSEVGQNYGRTWTTPELVKQIRAVQKK